MKKGCPQIICMKEGQAILRGKMNWNIRDGFLGSKEPQLISPWELGRERKRSYIDCLRNEEDSRPHRKRKKEEMPCLSGSIGELDSPPVRRGKKNAETLKSLAELGAGGKTNIDH